MLPARWSSSTARISPRCCCASGRLAPDRVLAIARDVLDGLAAGARVGRAAPRPEARQPADGRVGARLHHRLRDRHGRRSRRRARAAGRNARLHGARAARVAARSRRRPTCTRSACCSTSCCTGARPASPPEPPSRRVPDVDPAARARDPRRARARSDAASLVGARDARDARDARAGARRPSARSMRAGPPEQRRITVMFVTRSDSSEFAPELSPEELQEIMAAERVGDPHGARAPRRPRGAAARPLSSWCCSASRWRAKTRPIRAVTAALEIRRRSSCSNRELAVAAGGAASMCGSGIHTGLAIVEVPEGETEAFAYGAPVDAAIALARRASAGQVLASAELQRRVATRRATGFRAASVTRSGPARPRSTCSRCGARRERARRAADRAVRRAASASSRSCSSASAEPCAGEGQLVLVRGESGIGKSRLLEEVRAQHRRRAAPLAAGAVHALHREHAALPVQPDSRPGDRHRRSISPRPSATRAPARGARVLSDRASRSAAAARAVARAARRSTRGPR